MSIILNTDSYKTSHYNQYPEGTTHISSYIEARGGEYDWTVFFGLQMFLKKYLAKSFTRKDIDEAEEMITAHGEPFNRAGWDYILNRYRGKLPLRIAAVKEGTIVPVSNVLVQVVNTDASLPWLTSYVETALLRAIWYPTTVATRSKFIKIIIQTYLDHTSDNPDAINFMLHDFGARGVSSRESAGIGGVAHLVNFMGTDTITALHYARKFYGETMAAYSVPAAEHSTITSWGKEHEVDAYRNMLKQFGGPGKIVSVVSDSYDIYNATANLWGGVLKDEVLAMGGRLVIRPDSGDPTQVPIELVEILADKFGFTVNSKGYKVLPDCVRVLQGDGINEDTILTILRNLKQAGYSAENLVFGMGGEMLQTPNRDTLKFAMKASAIKNDKLGIGWTDVYKDPVTDLGKRSKRGRLGLINTGNGLTTVSEMEANGHNLLEDVYVNGQILRNQSLSEIREIANGSAKSIMKSAA